MRTIRLASGFIGPQVGQARSVACTPGPWLWTPIECTRAPDNEEKVQGVAVCR